MRKGKQRSSPVLILQRRILASLEIYNIIFQVYFYFVVIIIFF